MFKAYTYSTYILVFVAEEKQRIRTRGKLKRDEKRRRKCERDLQKNFSSEMKTI